MKTIKLSVDTSLSHASIDYALKELASEIWPGPPQLLVHQSQFEYAEGVVSSSKIKVVVVEQNDTDDWALEVGDYRIEVTAP